VPIDALKLRCHRHESCADCPRLRPHFLDRLPEAERAVGDREFGADRKPTPLEVEEQFPPGLRALAHALDEADELLFALRRGADDDQQALRVVLQASLTTSALK
jgi:hypothetical protein